MPSEIYREISQVLSNFVSKWDQYESDCNSFALSIRNELISLLECSTDEIKRLNLSQFNYAPEEHEMFLKKSLTGHMWLDKDAFWHTQYRLYFGNHFVQVQLDIKRINDSYMIRSGPTTVEVPLNAVRQAADIVLNSTKKYLDTEFENFLDGNYSSRPMGFKAGSK